MLKGAKIDRLPSITHLEHKQLIAAVERRLVVAEANAKQSNDVRMVKVAANNRRASAASPPLGTNFMRIASLRKCVRFWPLALAFIV